MYAPSPPEPCLQEYKYVCLRVDISVLVMGDASAVMGYDRRTLELSNVPLLVKQDVISIEK